MSNNISEAFLSCLENLCSDKATERKLAYENFPKFLADDSLVETLDENSSRNEIKGRYYTWNSLLKVVKLYLSKEANKILSKSNNDGGKKLSSAAQTSKINCVKLFKILVKGASRKRAKAKPPNFFPCILSILDKPDLRSLFGQDFSQILVKDVLTSELLVNHMTTELFSSIFNTYRGFYTNLPEGWKLIFVLSVHEKLLRLSKNLFLPSKNVDDILNFLQNVFSNIKEESINHYEGLLEATLDFTHSHALDSRLAVCSLGEKIIPYFRKFWDKAVSFSMRAKILDFFHLQIVVHNPNGHLETGSLSHNTKDWHSHLKLMFNILIKECESGPQKSKLTTNYRRGVFWSSEFVSLTVEVCNLVFSMKDDQELGEALRAFKRPRSLYTIFALLDPLEKLMSSIEIIPWLQILTGLLQKYPAIFQLDELLKLLNTISLIQLATKQVEVRSHILKCNRTLISAYVTKNHPKDEEVFVKVFERAVRMVALNQSREEAHGLLQSLLCQKLVRPNDDFHRLYFPGSSNPVTSSSLQTLIIFLENFPIPTHRESIGNFLADTRSSPRKHSYQTQVLQWMFPSSDEYLMPRLRDNFQLMVNLAKVSVFLCCREGYCQIGKNRQELPMDVSDSSEVWKKYNGIKEGFLKSTFDFPFDNYEPRQSDLIFDKALSPSIIVAIKNQIILSVDNETGILFDPLQNITLDIFAKHASFLIILRKLMMKYGIATDFCKLDHLIKRILGKIGDEFKACLKETLNLASKVISSLLKAAEFESSCSDWLWPLIPNSLLDDLLTAISLNQENMDTSSPTASARNNFYPPSASTRLNSSMAYKELDDLMDVEPTTSQATCHTTGSKIEESTLPSTIKQDIVEFFVKYCLGKQSPDTYKKKLINTINLDRINVNSTENVQLVLCLVESLLKAGTELDDDDVAYIITNIRSILRRYRTKSEFSTNCVRILKECVQLVIPLPHEIKTRVDNRALLVKMTNSLWTRQREEWHSDDFVIALINLSVTFLRYDVMTTWCDYDPKENDRLSGPVHDLIRMLESPRLQIRLYAAKKLGDQVLSNLAKSWETSHLERLKEIYDRSYKVLYENTPGTIDSPSISPYLSSLLVFLYHSATSSLDCERHCVFALFQIVKMKNLQKDLASKVLVHLGHKLGLSSSLPIVQLHFLFIASNWLDSNYSLNDFPFTFFECQTLREFFRKYQPQLVPFLAQRLQNVQLDEIAKELGKETKMLILDLFPMIVTQILPLLTADNDTKKQKIGANCMSNMCKITNDLNLLEKQIRKASDRIVLNLLLCLNETPTPLEFHNYKQFLPPSNCSNFVAEDIIRSLEFVKNSHAEINNAIQAVAAVDCGIPNLLFGIRAELFQAERKEERVRIILVYRLFAKLVTPLFETTLKGLAPFIAKEIAQTMLNQLKLLQQPLVQIDQCIATICIDILKFLCSDAVEIIANSASDLILDIIDSTLLLKDNVLTKEVSDLLNILVVEKGPILSETLSLVDELPDEPYLSQIREKHQRFKKPVESLEEAITFFLNVTCRRKNSVRKEGLLQLLHKLRDKREEIVNMALRIRNEMSFSEDLEESSLHLTICHLLAFGQSPCLEIRQIAAQCLGEIGPVDLGSPILPKISSEAQSNLNSFTSSKEYKIYRDLAKYASDKRIKVFSSATMALKNLFSTTDGRIFLAKCKRNGESWLTLYFHPLLSSMSVNLVEMEVDFSFVDDGELWCPKTKVSYQVWISQLVCSLIRTGAHRSNLLKELEPLCLVEPQFCEKIFPYVISKILEHTKEVEKDILSRHLSSFVAKHCYVMEEGRKLTDSQSTVSSYENSEESLYRDKNALQTILNVIHYLRMQPSEKKEGTIWQTNFALNINYLSMASAASYCGAYFTSLLYLELWCDETNRIMIANEDPDFDSQGSSRMSRLSSHDQINKVQHLLLESFKGIGDIDGVHGCSRVFGDSFPLRLCLYEQENKWDRVLSICDSEITGENSNLNLGILKALQRSSLTNTFRGYLRGLTSDASEPSPQLAEYQAECAWRTSEWNFTLPQTSNTGVHRTLFKALSYLEIKDYESSSRELNLGREIALNAIPRNSLEAVKSVYPFLSQLQAFATIETSIRLKDDPVTRLLNEWKIINLVPFGDFELFEPNLTLQTVILSQMMKSGGPPTIKGLRNTLEKILKVSRDENHLEVAVNALRRLKMEYQDEVKNSLRLKLEEARIYWKRGETNVAKQVLKSLLKPLELQVDEKEGSGKTPLYAETLIQYGKWQAETSGESTNQVMNYLEKALSMLKKSNSDKELIDDAHLAVARFSDAQYLSLSKYRKTPEFQKKLQSMINAQDEAKKLKRLESQDREMRKAIMIRERQCNIDKSELDSVEANLRKFRDKAMHNYIFCLNGTNAHDLRVFRVISLWFENYQDEKLNESMKEEVLKLPTYKFLPLVYQLAARMGTQDSEKFDRILIQLMKRMCQDHPHHTVPILLALSNANKDEEITRATTSKSRKKALVGDVQEKRIAAAKEVISFLKKTKMDYITQIENLAYGYIELAYVQTAKDSKKSSKYKLPSALRLLRGSYDKVPVLTKEIPTDYSCKYENIVCIRNFGNEFNMCGGINAPKRIECFGQDGRKHSQLVKGQDDIRQDAVMQEVFTLVNRFLDKNVETRKRNLRIRTYKIIPLSKRSGVLQWCEGTQPFGEYLIGGNKSAHSRYYPQEWTASKCREHISQAGTADFKLKLYQEVCEKFSPVFRYFFLERFPEPTKWYERRLAYSRSVAASSIVGYILGLGDRHVQNILVDLRTAELIHIDFGIAFEQGKILPTPETVPFRLSREIVDGFGICGVEGPFRQCCEKTMEVMRSSQESLLTILEVLLYDPLYMWSISPDKAAYIQRKRADESRFENGNDSDTNNQGVEVNKLAERTLLRLQQKLQGVEDNVALSVSGQVGLLIQQARDPENLCSIFAGWQPYL